MKFNLKKKQKKKQKGKQRRLRWKQNKQNTEMSKTTKKKENLFPVIYRDVWKVQVERKVKHSADKGSEVWDGLPETPRNSTKVNAKSCS